MRRIACLLMLLCLLLLVSCMHDALRDAAGDESEFPATDARTQNETETPDVTDTETNASGEDADAPPNVEDDRWSYYY